MDKRILYGGAAALAAYFWWASRSNSTATGGTTRTTSTTPNGVGFGIGDLLNKLVVSDQIPAPDAKVNNPVTVPVTGGQTPRPATVTGFDGAGGVQNDGVARSNAPASTLGLYQQLDLGQVIRNLDFSAGNEGQSAAALYDYMVQNKVDTSNVGAAVGWSGADVSKYIFNATGKTV